jgi:hypothetical protein
MKDDNSFDMDECAATTSIDCPVVRDAVDDLLKWAEVCLVEIEWVKEDANRDS